MRRILMALGVTLLFFGVWRLVDTSSTARTQTQMTASR
jgi:hypothetical protein